jgi:hypothetical protein
MAGVAISPAMPDVGVEVVPGQHNWTAELLVGAVEQGGVVGLGEPPAPTAPSLSESIGAWGGSAGKINPSFTVPLTER